MLSRLELSLRLFSAVVLLGSASSLSPVTDAAIGDSVSKTPRSTVPRYFTVRDSIEMARFVRTGAAPLFSPDQSQFVIVTSRGILESDEIESTLWLFDSQEVSKFVLAQASSMPPRPRVLARFRAIPEADYSDSYEPIISAVSWVPDSKRVLFLAQNSAADRQIYQADMNSGKLRSVSRPGLDVNQYAVAGNTVVYTATSSSEDVSLGRRINRDAVDVSGLAWSSFLFLDRLAADSLRCNELWVFRGWKNTRVGQGSDREPCLLNRYDQVLSLSPDSKSVVVVAPVRNIPQSWRSYRPSFPDRIIDPDSPEETALTNPLRLTQYQRITLANGSRQILLDSPNAWALGFADLNGAVWSKNGKRLLLLNTYLPLQDSKPEGKAKRSDPCSAAIIDLTSHATDCLAFSDYPKKQSFLVDASFVGDDEMVLLEFRDAQNRRTLRRFRLLNGTWQAAGNDLQSMSLGSSDVRRKGEQNKKLSVDIRQDLNSPPALWATNVTTSQSKKIWDPNPQLATVQLGEASVFKWQDTSGHQWTGGLVKPPDYIKGRRYPLVIQTHGFLQQEFISDGQYTTAFAARPLAAAGIMVLQMGENYSYTSLAEEAPLQILGFESAIEHLASEDLIDRSKVGVIGFSRTCYHVESALIQDPKLFAAATIADGVDQSYLQEMLFGVASSARESEEIYGAKPLGEGLKRWIESAPGFHLDRVQTPLRIEALRPESVLGEWEIYSSLTMQRKPVELVYFPQGQHILQRPLERLASQQGNVDWFRFWLKNEEDPAAFDASEYTRWRKMREKTGGSTISVPQ